MPDTTTASPLSNSASGKPARPVYRLDGPYAWFRAFVCLLLASVGGAGIWVIAVVLKTVQTDFGVDRGTASIAYFACMIGFGVGSVLMGMLADRIGMFLTVIIASVCLSLGFISAAYAQDIWQFAAINGILIGLGASATFGPLLADISLWFEKRRGTAIGICASGNYLAGAIWPLVVPRLMELGDWRSAYVIVGCACIVLIWPLALVLRPPSPKDDAQPAALTTNTAATPASPLPKGVLQTLLIIAGVACCVAMAMPQVHIVAYCLDLGYTLEQGTEVISLMLATGVVSRLAFGAIADKIGGARTVLLGAILQTLALGLYLPFDGLMSIYVVSAIFGLSQGGIVPSYAVAVREYFPAKEAGFRVSIVMMATVFGMALGGWLSGVIYDLTGSYQAAFLHGIAWNLLNVAVMLFVLWRFGQTRPALAPA